MGIETIVGSIFTPYVKYVYNGSKLSFYDPHKNKMERLYGTDVNGNMWVDKLMHRKLLF